jgi:hypothetical protein
MDGWIDGRTIIYLYPFSTYVFNAGWWAVKFEFAL